MSESVPRLGSAPWTYELEPDWHQIPPEIGFVEAIGVSVDSRDRVYVFNRGDPPIIVLDTQGQVLSTWGTGLFVRPHGITVANDTLWLTDDLGHAVHQYSLDGRLLTRLEPSGIPSDTGAEGFDHRAIVRGAGPFNLPTNVAVNDQGEAFVADGYGNARVHRFSSTGEWIQSWGEPGRAEGQFCVPHGIAIDHHGRVLVADRENSRVQVFDQEGQFLSQWLDVVRPCDFFVDSDGWVHIAELGDHNGRFPWQTCPASPTGGRVSVFDQDGNSISRFGGGLNPRDSGSFYACHDLCIDSAGSIYVGEVSQTVAAASGEEAVELPSLRKFVRV